MRNLNPYSRFSRFAISLLFLFGCVAGAAAEEPALPKIESGKVGLSWSDLKVLLDELESLKRFKQQEESKKEKDTPPAEYSITQARFDGTTEEGAAKFKAEFRVEVLKNGWVSIPFFSNDTAIESSEITDKNNREAANPIAQFARDPEGYRLIAKGPASLTIRSVFGIPIRMENLTYTLSFLPPRSVINRLTLRIPQKNANLVQTVPFGNIEQKEEATTFRTILSERDTLKLAWKIEKDSGISRKRSAQVNLMTSVEKSALTVVGNVTLRHLTSPDQVAFHIPASVEILNVTSPDIDRWFVEPADTMQIVKVSGQINRNAPLELMLSYRMRLPALPAQVGIPVIELQGVDDIEGFLGIEVLENLKITPGDVKNGMIINPKNLPKSLLQRASNPILHGYEFHVPEFSLPLDIGSYQEIRTIVANVDMADCITHRTLEGKSITRSIYLIRNSDRQYLTLTLPPNSRLWQAFLDSVAVKPARNETGEILIPMKKSAAQGEDIRSFSIEIGYITEVSKLSLKGEISNELAGLDIPITYLRWSLYLPEYYEYTAFEGPLKQVGQFSNPGQTVVLPKAQLEIPTQGKTFLFEKYLMVDEKPYMRGRYGQNLGSDIFLSIRQTADHFQMTTANELTEQATKSRLGK